MNIIHPTAILGPDVELGDNNYIGPYCYITNKVIIGDNNRFEAFCSIGTPAEHKKTLHENSENLGVCIGNDNIIREYTSIHSGAFDITTIGNDNTLQRNCHIGHDAVIFDKTTLSCNTIVAGHVIVNSGVNMGLSSITHQMIELPPYCMLGMGSVVTKKTELSPFCIYVGNPAKFLKVNKVGIERSGLSKDEVMNILESWESSTGKKTINREEILCVIP